MQLRVLALIRVFVSQLAVAAVRQPQAQRASVEGTVFRAGTNEPITGIRVTLTRANQATGAPGGAGTFISFSTSSVGLPAPLLQKLVRRLGANL